MFQSSVSHKEEDRMVGYGIQSLTLLFEMKVRGEVLIWTLRVQ